LGPAVPRPARISQHPPVQEAEGLVGWGAIRILGPTPNNELAAVFEEGEVFNLPGYRRGLAFPLHLTIGASADKQQS